MTNLRDLAVHFRSVLFQIFTASGFLIGSAATAQTTVTYTYDDLGRLKDVTTDSTLTASYDYDAADNRTEKDVQGAATPTPPACGPVSGCTAN